METPTAYIVLVVISKHGGKVIDVIDFVMKMEGLDTGSSPAQAKHEALKKCKELLGGNGGNATDSLQNTFSVLQTQLPNSKKAQEYLKSRGLENLKEVGSNHRNGNNAVGYKYAHLKNCVVFPLKNAQGKIVSLYGRSFSITKQNGHFYLKNRAGLYPKYPPAETKHLILTESVIDAKTLELHANLPTDTNVLACYGTNGFTKEHAEAIKKLKSLETITIFFDGDTAGCTASKKLFDVLAMYFNDVQVSVVNTPDNEDINSLWTNNESIELFEHLLKTKEIQESRQKTTEPLAVPETNKKPVKNNQQLVTKPKEENQQPTTSNQQPKENNQQLNLTVKGAVKNLGDSLKVTLQSTYKGKHIIQKLDLYDYGMLEKQAKLTAKALVIEEAIISTTLARLRLRTRKRNC